MVYRFRVGQTDLGFTRYMKENPPNLFADEEYISGYNFSLYFFDKFQAKHVCFLLNRDLFEYGPNGWSRRKEIGRDPNYDWDSLGGKLNGTTYTSPNELEKYIKQSNEWEGDEYNFMNHNCQDFVKFCLNCCGARSMSFKKGPCYRRQNK